MLTSTPQKVLYSRLYRSLKSLVYNVWNIDSLEEQESLVFVFLIAMYMWSRALYVCILSCCTICFTRDWTCIKMRSPVKTFCISISLPLVSNPLLHNIVAGLCPRNNVSLWAGKLIFGNRFQIEVHLETSLWLRMFKLNTELVFIVNTVVWDILFSNSYKYLKISYHHYEM